RPTRPGVAAGPLSERRAMRPAVPRSSPQRLLAPVAEQATGGEHGLDRLTADRLGPLVEFAQLGIAPVDADDHLGHAPHARPMVDLRDLAVQPRLAVEGADERLGLQRRDARTLGPEARGETVEFGPVEGLPEVLEDARGEQ